MINLFHDFWDQKERNWNVRVNPPLSTFWSYQWHALLSQCSRSRVQQRITVHVILMQFNLTCSLVAFLPSVMQASGLHFGCSALQCSVLCIAEWPRAEGRTASRPLPPVQPVALQPLTPQGSQSCQYHTTTTFHSLPYQSQLNSWLNQNITYK